MNEPGTSLDSRLKALLGGLDTSSDFDARVMSRVQAESAAVAAERVRLARRLESSRYGAARKELGWLARIRRLETLDLVGVTVLAALGAQAIWVDAAPQIGDFVRQYGSQLLTGLGVVLGVTPLFVLQIDRLRRQFEPAE